MRNFRSISIKEKIFIISQIIVGEKIKPLAKKHKVSRPSVYLWRKRALDSLEQALKPDKRGPKFKKGQLDVKDKITTEQMIEIGKLKKTIANREKEIKNLREKISLQKMGIPRPLKCPYCGFEKIYKNGTYKIRIERFFEKLKKGEEKEIVVQQFICPYCKSSIHNQEKKRRIILS